MKVEIDPYAGFCFGVEKAIQQAEINLTQYDSLHCLGEIVHNHEEVNRLENLGLQTIDSSTFKTLKNTSVLIRAHGEPPETYKTAKKNNIALVEATCPIVLKLQEKVRLAWVEMEFKGGTVVIAGKKNHPEVTGLAGQTNHNALIVENMNDLNNINYKKPIRLFAQTTFSKKDYDKIEEEIKSRMKKLNIKSIDFQSSKSICGQVSRRIPKLKVFCKKHDIILFVSGKNSSNGKALYEICKGANPLSFHISSPEELDSSWTKQAKSVGISGATSTPVWLMEAIANKITE